MPGLDVNELDKGNNAKHPIHVIQEILNKTPVDMIEHEYKQGPDGSIEIKIKVPGRAEQAKQRAMEQAEKAMHAPSTNPSPAAGAQADVGTGVQQLANKSHVVVKVAMSANDIRKELAGKFPQNFLKSLDLL